MHKSQCILAVALAAVAILALSLNACGSEEESAASVGAVEYRAYLEENAAALVRAVQAMQPELENGEVERAGSRFARARVRYSQVEPAAEAFATLDARINALPGQVPANELRGFHAIERSLFEAGNTAGTAVIGRRLIADTKELERRLASVPFSAEQLAAGATTILDEIAQVTLAGKEQPYAGADLVDVSANLEAVAAAYHALEPTLTDEERQQLQPLLRRAYAGIGAYGVPARDPDQPWDRSPGTQFTVFEELSAAEVKALREQAEALGAAFAEVRDRLADE
jgi:iron uptake system component EfeO